MMRHLLIAAALLVASPALANWGKTQWGMTPDQVAAAVPGARVTPHVASEDVMRHQMLAFAPASDGPIKLLALFFFDPATNGLKFVRTEALDPAQCEGWRTMMIARYGPGTSETRGALGVTMTALRWTDPATQEKLMFSTITGTQGIQKCLFITNWLN